MERLRVAERQAHFLCDGIIGLMLLELIILKKSGVIDWHWLFIVSPIYLPILIALFVLITYLVTGETLRAFQKRWNERG